MSRTSLFFGERLGCKSFVEDLFTDLDRLTRQGGAQSAAVAEVLKIRRRRPDASIDGILCWDLIDYLDRQAAWLLAAELIRMLRPGGTLLGFFGSPSESGPGYTKHEIVDDLHLRHRSSATRPSRRGALPNRDIIRLFDGLLVSRVVLVEGSYTRGGVSQTPSGSGEE